MTHPTIEHIDDVLPHIAGRKDFIIADKGGYKVIDYVYTLADSFDDPMRLECRGIKFGADGKILARPLHKFFNINEREDTQAHALDFSAPHTVMEKLDGSMIHAALVDGEVVFMTRMGRTDVAIKAERHLPAVRDFCRGMLLGGATPIFEFTAPDNRIIVRYEESALTLLAVRDTVGGSYLSRDLLSGFGLPVVATHSSLHTTGTDFAAYARAVTGSEGFVVVLADGLWVKAKGEDYVLKHRAKDSILQEKNILQLAFSGGLDDVLALLEDKDKDAAIKYRDELLSGAAKTAAMLRGFVADNDNVSQKDFAVDHVRRLPAVMRGLAFAIRKGADADDAVREYLIASATSQARVDECRELHGTSWTI